MSASEGIPGSSGIRDDESIVIITVMMTHIKIVIMMMMITTMTMILIRIINDSSSHTSDIDNGENSTPYEVGPGVADEGWPLPQRGRSRSVGGVLAARRASARAGLREGAGGA